MIPYQGGKGQQIIKSVRETIKRLLSSNTKVQKSLSMVTNLVHVSI